MLEREHLNSCMHPGMCVCERQAERAHAQVLAHGHVCECQRERVVRYMHMGMCVCMCVCERESMGQLNAHGCLSVCVLAQVPSHGSGATQLWSPETREVEGAMPATRGGKQGLLLDSLGMAWGWVAWGSTHTDCRDSRLGTYTRRPRTTSGTGWSKRLQERQCSPSLLALC